MSHGDHRPQRIHSRARNRLGVLAWPALIVVLALASVPAFAQYEYRRTITVDRTKVTNPALLPIAFDAVSSAITADAGAASLSWNHTVGSGNDKIAIVSVSSAQAAITADSGSSLGGGGVPDLTLSHTVAAGNNKALIVSVCIRGNTTVSGVTYAGTPLSPIGAIDNTGNVRVEMWGLLNVAPQTANVVVTMSASATFVVGVVSFSNVGSIPAARFASATGGASPATVTLASAAGEVVVDAMANVVTNFSGAPTVTVGAGQTANWTSTYIPSQVRGSGSREAGAPSVTMSWTLGASVAWAIGAVPLTPAGTTQVMFGATDITANLIGTVTNTGNCAVSMYYLKNPPSGDNTVAVTQTGSTRFAAGAFTLFNVDQTTPLGTFASGTGSGVNLDAAWVSIPGASGEVIVATLAKRYNYAVRPEQSTHQADRWQLATGLGTANDILGVGTLRGGEASAQAYWALTGAPTQQWAIGGVPVKPTTVAPAQITTLSNYPLLVSLSDTTLRTVGNGGHVQSANGYDIVFRASDGVTQLDHEIERYDGVNGQVVAWVRLPSVNGAGAGSDTQIYIYYGYKGVSGPTQNKTAVWDASHMEVWHLAEPSGNATDSTSNGYVATVQGTGIPTRPAAKIDGGFHFAGDSWLLTNDGQFNVANAPFTIEGWFYIDGPTVPTWVGIATKNRDVTCTDNPPYCDWAGVWIGGSSELNYAWDWHNQANMGGGAALSTGSWYHGTIVFDGGMRTGYRNGVRDTVITAPNPSPGIYTSLTMPTRINQDMTGGANLTGTFDEVRISTTARTPGWILTSYNNMNNPGNIGDPGFYTVGSEDLLRFYYRRLITVADSMTPSSCSSNLTSFPVLISITDSALRSVANGGHVQNANGYDIVFRAADGIAALDHEIEKYNPATGQLVAWVRIPTLVYNGPTTLYMYYGNPGIITPTANPTGVWNTTYGWKGVWHFHDDFLDSTPDHYNGTNYGSTDTAGKIADGQQFDGIDDYVDVSSANPQSYGEFTFSAWYKSADATTSDDEYIYNHHTDSTHEIMFGPNDGVSGDDAGHTDQLRLFIETSSGYYGYYSTTDVVDQQWHYLAAVRTSTGGIRIHVDDTEELDDPGDIIGTINLDGDGPYIGDYPGDTEQVHGILDEVRFSNTARDACWIGTEYANQGSPGTHVTVDPEQPLPPDYGYQRPISIPDSMTPASCSSNLSNFPVLVSIVDPTLRSKSTGGHVENANGYDIVFRAADGITALDHEIERYVATTGELIAWVRIPTLVYNAATGIYMFYGNPGITSPTANPTGLWNASYGWRGVWHLKESPSGVSGEIKDSSSNANNGTTAGTMDASDQVPGKIDGSLDFDGLDDLVDFGNPGSLQLTGALTLSTWVYVDTFGVSPATNVNSRFVTKSGDEPERGWELDREGVDGKAHFIISADGTSATQSRVVSTANVPTGQWVQYVGVYEPSTAVRIYVNGLLDNSNTTSIPAAQYNAANNVRMAARTDCANCYLDGKLDEVRISSVARNACWTGTEYSSMATPATVGVEAANAPTVVKLVSLDAAEYAGRGVRVSWRTGFEVDNLGFHVYREMNGERVRVTPSLIAGSALFAGAGTPLTAGQSYAWWDRSPVTGASYWLEEWELSGAKRWHGPVSVQPGSFEVQAQGLSVPASGGSVQGSSPLLAGLGQPASASPPQGVRRKLRQALASDEARLAVQWGLASRPAVKLLVSEAGWTRVEQEELVRAGLNPSVDPGRLQLYADGLQVPILVDVEQHGAFASGDGIEFFGQGLDTPATGVRVYWLVEGAGAGVRIPEASGGGGWAPGPASFPYEVERADRTLYFPALLNGDEGNFFGAVVTATPVVQSVRVPHVDQASPGELVVRLQGGTAGAHRVGMELNGTRVGTVAWEGMAAGELAVPVGGHMILEGDNRVVLAAEGGEGDVSVVESIQVRYAHTWQADGEALEFTLGGYQQVGIGGFRSSEIKVLDITDPWAVQALSADVVEEGEGYTATVGVPEAGERTLLAVGTGGVRHPVGVLPNRPSAWHQATDGADLLIIAHRSLLQALEPLRAVRERQGLKVSVVDVESVFDEFSYGARDPQAIKDFLACARDRWSRPPRYLLLVGDASYDPRNYLGYGFLDLLPTRLVDTTYMETASDDWFADFDGDGIGDIPVGRLPVMTAWEATTVVGKIVAYEDSVACNRVLLVADANDEENDFEALSATVKAALPATLTVAEVFRGALGDAAAKNELISQLNLGQTLVNYIGHGSTEIWHRNLLTATEACTLANKRLPLWLPMTCLNGYFQAPYGDSLAEALLKAPSGGAVAVWASSGLTESADQIPIDEALIRLLYSGSTTIGDATLTAKHAASNFAVRQSWILLGDPTTRLKP